MIKVLFCCHGNICRSTMAEFVMKELVRRAGREQEFLIQSAATSREEIGADTHPGARQAVQLTAQEYDAFDYIMCMDEENIRNIRRITGGDPGHKVYRLLHFAGQQRSVADPWYTGDFSATWEDVLAGCSGLLGHTRNL